VPITGLANAKAALAAVRSLAEGNALTKALEDDIYKQAVKVQAAAQKLAPLDEGTLEGSAQTEIELTGAGITVGITFGGMASKYAEVQHENETLKHPRRGQAHFLYGDDSAWEAERPGVLAGMDRACGKQSERIIQQAAGTS